MEELKTQRLKRINRCDYLMLHGGICGDKSSTNRCNMHLKCKDLKKCNTETCLFSTRSKSGFCNKCGQCKMNNRLTYAERKQAKTLKS
jgi:hypothetical protein